VHRRFLDAQRDVPPIAGDIYCHFVGNGHSSTPQYRPRHGCPQVILRLGDAIILELTVPSSLYSVFSAPPLRVFAILSVLDQDSLQTSSLYIMAPLNVCMVGTGEYTTGFVGGGASGSDKKVGVVGLTLFDLRRRGKVGNLSMVGTSGNKFPAIRKY
jgi:hypothetical protein